MTGSRAIPGDGMAGMVDFLLRENIRTLRVQKRQSCWIGSQ